MAQNRASKRSPVSATATRPRAKALKQDKTGATPAPANDTAAASIVTSPGKLQPGSARRDDELKSALRRFVLEAAGTYRGRNAAKEFTSRLLTCFGWQEDPRDASMPATLSIVDNGERATREVPLLWSGRRVLVEVVQPDAVLEVAWKELLRACLQVDPVPQYVLLTNRRDLHLYDLARERSVPRLAIHLDDLPKYSEAFPFLSTAWVPGNTPQIIDVSRVSREVAELVAKLYLSLKEQHPKRDRDVVQFTLQCIVTMFAEDVGLIPREYFTTLLYEGTRNGDVEKRLSALFYLMSKRDAPAPRAVPFFNGGLFTKPVTLPLGDGQLRALTKAAEANWKYVDPHIFGSVFQGIMNDTERHKSGAHYTAHDDIMRVVGPTIVKPWRQRIDEAKSLADLLDLRAALHQFRVLDPACGSGNFLYVAFRELYRLDTGLLARVRDFPSTQGHGKGKVAWGAAIPTSNFFGIDINPFAVALAKVTLNIAKKIAFDERREIAADLGGQLELEVDPSLPLDNLDDNIICADALFTEWPGVDAIVGNPPILGGIKVREELGPKYLERLQRAFPTVNGRADYCVYWFRRAHDHLLSGKRAGLVGTSGIRVGWSREAALDYIASRDGTITNAVSSRVWPGEAALNVSMVNWVKDRARGPFELIVEDEVYQLPHIATHLQLHCDVSEAHPIVANNKGTTRGVMFGHDAFRSESGVSPFERGQRAIRPIATGDDLLRGRLGVSPEVCIWLSDCDTELAAKERGGRAFAHLKANLYPWLKNRAEGAKETKHYATWIRRWWQPHYKREEFFSAAANLRRWIACSRVGSRPIFAFLSAAFVPNDTIQLFAFDDDYSFGVIQSSLHWGWTKAKGGKVTERITYSTDAWTTFPWPQEPNAEEVGAVASAARALRGVRDELMKANGWSLRALYQAANVEGHHPLNAAQATLDEAVRAAYGMPADVGITDFLLELNKLVAEDEIAGRKVQGPGVPKGLDPSDPRWRSDDCIEPPDQGGLADG